VNTITLALAIVVTLLSAIFFVGGKVVMARFSMPWTGVWVWTLLASAGCGLCAWMLMGAPSVMWQWCLLAGIAGALAHIGANLALSWGEASVLVPLSGAKPLVLLALVPLISGQALPVSLLHASWLATCGIMLTSLSPRRVHRHALRPGVALLLMSVAVVLMAVSDLCGRHGVAETEAHGGQRWAAIAAWNIGLGILPIAYLLVKRPSFPRAGVVASLGLGVIFSGFIATLALAFAIAPDPANAVASVNVVVATRGALAILMVLVADHWLKLQLEPIPRWVHAMRFTGAIILVVAVALTLF
jgi:drug/metabolite transporter (DMT)-like permease